MPKKKNKNVVFIIFVILFGVYLALYYAFLGGYYEYKAYNKKNLTEEMMKKFERDSELPPVLRADPGISLFQ